MEKLKVFLDTSVVISYLQGNKELENLFSQSILREVRYMVSSVVYQEIIFATDRMEMIYRRHTRTELAKFDSFVEVIPDDASKMRLDPKKLRDLRNLMIHSNDILILQTALLNCDYLLTLDKELLEIRKMASLRIVSPAEFFPLVEGRQ
jgi:predicted nucleic acid-binding protein